MKTHKHSEETKAIFCKNLNYYLKNSKKTQREVAKSIGTLPTTFSAWVRGESMPRPDKLTALADYFKISEADLLKDAQTISIDNLSIRALRDLYEFVKYLQLREKGDPSVESLLDIVKDVPPDSENKFIAEMAKLEEKDVAEIRKTVKVLSETPIGSRSISKVVTLFEAINAIGATTSKPDKNEYN